MKTFVVYDLDSKMPVAVGEQVTAETARYCASVATGIFHANLFAEEIDLEKKLPTSPESGTGKRKASNSGMYVGRRLCRSDFADERAWKGRASFPRDTSAWSF